MVRLFTDKSSRRSTQSWASQRLVPGLDCSPYMYTLVEQGGLISGFIYKYQSSLEAPVPLLHVHLAMLPPLVADVFPY